MTLAAIRVTNAYLRGERTLASLRHALIDRSLSTVERLGAIHAVTNVALPPEDTNALLVDLLNDKSLEIVAAALHVLGELKNPIAIPFVRPLTTRGSQPTILYGAYCCLGKLGDDAIIAACEQFLASPKMEDRHCGIMSLYGLGTSVALDLLESHFATEQDFAIRIGLGHMLLRKGRSTVVDFLLSALDKPDPDCCWKVDIAAALADRSYRKGLFALREIVSQWNHPCGTSPLRVALQFSGNFTLCPGEDVQKQALGWIQSKLDTLEACTPDSMPERE